MPQYAKLSFPFDFLARFAYLRRLPWQLATVLLLTLIAATARIFLFSPGDWEKDLLLILLAAALMVNSCRFLPEDKKEFLAQLNWRQRLPAWAIMITAIISCVINLQNNGWLQYNILKPCPVLMLVLAACVYWGGTKAGGIFFLPVLICTLVLPNREVIALAISFRLRLISTMLAVETLQLLGQNLTYHLTSISLPESEIAITDACSGIDQLEVLLFLGYLLVKSQHTRKRWSFIHYLLMLPAVILLNAVRIASTVVLFNWLGAVVFDDFVHTLLGYTLVIAVTALLWWLGRFFPDYTEPLSHPPQISSPDSSL